MLFRSFLVLFSLQNKNKIGGDSNFSKINFSQIKSESRRSSEGAREKCESTPAISDYYVVYLQESDYDIRTSNDPVHFHKPLAVVILINGLMP